MGTGLSVILASGKGRVGWPFGGDLGIGGRVVFLEQKED